jgi:hypothetical protein
MTEQERLFNPDRFSPVHPEVVLRLPEGSTRTFWVASMLGSYLKWDGSRRPLRSVEEASGTFVSKRVARRVREVLAISQRRWQQLAMEWERLGIAHRCGSSELFIFTRVLLEECPACNQIVLLDDAVRNRRSSRGEGSLRIKRNSPSHKGEEALRILGTKGAHPRDGSPKGIREPYDGLKALEYMKADGWTVGGKRRAKP